MAIISNKILLHMLCRIRNWILLTKNMSSGKFDVYLLGLTMPHELNVQTQNKVTSHGI